MTNLVTTKEVDYLEEDMPIKNQNYCLLSFITPNDVLKNKESYYLKYFFKKFSQDMDSLFNGLITKFPDEKSMIENIKKDHEYLFDINSLDEQYKFSKTVNSQEVESEFHKDNNFQTTISGVKVRGVFDTIEQAKNRCALLHKKDKNHNIFIGQVGCWCPFAPNPTDLEEQEYAETQLNTLMKEYKKNQENKNEIFENRRLESIKNKSIIEESEQDDNNQISNLSTSIDGMFTEDDSWTQQKNLKDNEIN